MNPNDGVFHFTTLASRRSRVTARGSSLSEPSHRRFFRAYRLRPQHLFLYFTLALCPTFWLPLSSHAALSCAARTYTKEDLAIFRQSVKEAIRGTDLLEKSLQLYFRENVRRGLTKQTVFDRVTAFFHAKEYSPKDVVCVADTDVPTKALARSPIWDTYSGITVLLSPQPIDPPATPHGPRSSNVFTWLAEAVAYQSNRASCPQEGTLFDFPLPRYSLRQDYPVPQYSRMPRQLAQQHRPPQYFLVDTQLKEECQAKRLKKRKADKEALLAGLPSALLGTPNVAIVETYDASSADSRSNVIAVEAFVGAVASLEALNGPLYGPPTATAEQSGSREFRVINPVDGQPLPTTSLLKFVGNELVNLATRLLFREHLQFVTEFRPGVLPRIDVIPNALPARRSDSVSVFKCTRTDVSGVYLSRWRTFRRPDFRPRF